MRTLSLMAIAACCAGCFTPVGDVPVVGAVGRVTACHGECPGGACEVGCAATGGDGGCGTPEACLQAETCRRGGLTDCSTYAARFEPATSCVEGATFCVDLQLEDGGTARIATDCRAPSPATFSCRGTCDGGAPTSPSCRDICGATYCVE